MEKKQWVVLVVLLSVLLAVIAGLGQAKVLGLPEQASSMLPYTNWDFTYQGFLKDGGAPANGIFDFKFSVCDDPVLTNCSVDYVSDVTVSQGIFTARLSVYGLFSGGRRWIEVAVRPGLSTGDYTVLSPREEITAAPYAHFALHQSSLSSPDSDPQYALVVDNAGKVGINTTTPAEMLEVNGNIKSTADTIIAASPYDFDTLDSVTILESEMGYVYVRPNATSYQSVYLSPTLPAIVFGVRQKLKGVTVCYQVDNTSSWLTRIEAYYSAASGERVFMFEDDTDHKSTTYDCFDYFDPTPDTIVGTTVIRLWGNFGGTGYEHDIVIGRVTLWLTEQ